MEKRCDDDDESDDDEGDDDDDDDGDNDDVDDEDDDDDDVDGYKQQPKVVWPSMSITNLPITTKANTNIFFNVALFTYSEWHQKKSFSPAW